MVLLIPDVQGTSYSQLIEAFAHKRLPVREVPFFRYVNGASAAKKLSASPDALFEHVLRSTTEHGVMTANGVFLIHPDSMHRLARYQYRSIRRKIRSLTRQDYVRLH